MSYAKRKLSVSLDEDLVAELEAVGQSISAQINVAVRTELEQRRRQRLLAELLDRLDAEHGPVEEALVPVARDGDPRPQHRPLSGKARRRPRGGGSRLAAFGRCPCRRRSCRRRRRHCSDDGSGRPRPFGCRLSEWHGRRAALTRCSRFKALRAFSPGWKLEDLASSRRGAGGRRDQGLEGAHTRKPRSKLPSSG
jgi:post-segregation antitoxin (ccd killing protein)